MTAEKGVAMLAGLGGELRSLWRELGDFLAPEDRSALRRIGVLSAVFSLLEMSIAAAALPYVDCLGSGQCGLVAGAARRLGLDAVVLYSLGLLALMSIKMLADMALHWKVTGFQQHVQQHTVMRLLSAYLAQGWARYRQRNRNDYFRRCAVTALDTAYACTMVASALSAGLVVLVLTGLLVAVNPWVSLGLVLAFLVLNAAVQRVLGQRQKRASQAREQALRGWHLGMGEALESFQELRTYRAERFVLDGIATQLVALAHNNRRLAFMPILPRVALDYLAFTLVLACVLLWSWTGRSLAGLLPYLVFYAIVARSLLPAMMQLLSIRTALRGAVINIHLVRDELAQAEAARGAVAVLPSVSGEPALLVEGLTLRHAGQALPVLSALSLQAEQPAWIALVGPSGVGKSTLLDTLAGLLQPEQGRVVWRTPLGVPPRLAYVPQHVAILDASLRDNVLFGLEAGQPEAMGAVEAALRVAQLGGYALERNALQLSGGERQRLAIARAVYRQPDLLLLDEATAAIDEATEAALFDAVRAALPQTTVVFITHRSTSLRFADVVWTLAQERVALAAA